MIRINDRAYKYLKNVARSREETIPGMIDIIIDIFQQIPIHAFVEPEEVKQYMTYKMVFYEQNKYRLEDYQRKFYERRKKNMKIFFDKYRLELAAFKVSYNKLRKKNNKEKLRKYNQQYYLNMQKINPSERGQP